MLKTKELFELPIYRLKEDEYNESLREHIKKTLLCQQNTQEKIMVAIGNIMKLSDSCVFMYQVKAKFVVNTGKRMQKEKLEPPRSSS